MQSLDNKHDDDTRQALGLFINTIDFFWHLGHSSKLFIWRAELAFFEVRGYLVSYFWSTSRPYLYFIEALRSALIPSRTIRAQGLRTASFLWHSHQTNTSSITRAKVPLLWTGATVKNKPGETNVTSHQNTGNSSYTELHIMLCGSLSCSCLDHCSPTDLNTHQE